MKEVERRDKNPVIVQPGARMNGPELRQLVQVRSRTDLERHVRAESYGILTVITSVSSTLIELEIWRMSKNMLMLSIGYWRIRH